MDVLDAVREVSGSDATSFLGDLDGRLASLGFRLIREVHVADRGDGRPGRVDRVAVRGAETIAIECDRKKARRKSIIKLGQVPATARLVVCREAA